MKKTSSRTEINNQNTDSVENKDTQKASNIFGGQNISITQDKKKGKRGYNEYDYYMLKRKAIKNLTENKQKTLIMKFIV